MKFLCDRCKTRYSIGDDRVRGKILKIRCKNCANVITVREGMSDVDAADPQGLRKRGTTQAVPTLSVAGTDSVPTPAPGSAAPPPALEQEWYVSLDGQQEGPFSLAEAQRWVGGKAYDAELHCWSEGFDDWLPVDKVSHFRGLRKKPAPAPAPPPLPRAATSQVRAAAPSPVPQRDSDPKPLFAATMAAIERAAPASPAAFSARQRPADAAPASRSHSSSPSGGGDPFGDNPEGFPMPSPIANATPPGGERALPASNGKPKLPAFDLDAALDTPTTIGSPAFDEPAADVNDRFAKALGAKPEPMPLATPSPAATPTVPAPDLDDDDDEDDGLSIGEVSRVVNLADLKPRPKPAPEQPAMRPSQQAMLNRTGSVPRLGNTAAVPRLGNTAAVPRLDDPNALLVPPLGDSNVALSPQVASSHRRGMLLLIGVAAAVLIGGGVAVALLVSGGNEDPLGGLVRGNDIDTTRPDDPLRKIELGDGSGGSNAVAQTPPTTVKRPNTGSTTRPQTLPKDPVPPPGGDRLGGDEIEAMARTNSAGTQRCYMRAQRGAEAILLGDVKKVYATLTIGTDGKVTGVSLDKAADSSFGKCLISTIGAWRFRASPGGTYKIALQFVSS